ncbi:hypothetical protein JVT61DRAFT_9060 [Boletus reticuloceps]|uniref:Uncharacterized protein n=1 Tax=Boletus reticuloceps TaxID=495285 RepID=A0A8I3A5D0_9AGAM|nr:hypothetical protein JVT61DRAFT_12575 [Boletus reticuloceps]KAG6371716.1 hypothetical protein JVT61DRAFT_9060 [Boletus reticuloceps]
MAAIPTVSWVAFITSDTVPIPSHPTPCHSPLPSATRLSQTCLLVGQVFKLSHLAVTLVSPYSGFPLQLVLLATELSSLPLVLHIAVKDDLSDILLLQSAFLFCLVSYTPPQEAHDNALLASRLARTEKKAVIHIFYELSDGQVIDIAEEDVQLFLLSEKTAPSSVPDHSSQVDDVDNCSND